MKRSINVNREWHQFLIICSIMFFVSLGFIVHLENQLNNLEQECPSDYTCTKNPAVCWYEISYPMFSTNLSNRYVYLTGEEEATKWYVAEEPILFIILDENGTEIPRCGE